MSTLKTPSTAPTTNTLASLLELFISTRRLAPKTVCVYQTTISQFSQFLGQRPRLRHLTDSELLGFERWLAGDRSPYTVRERTGRIKSLWRFAAKRGLVRTWPSLEPMPVPEVRPKAYTVPQINQLLTAARATPGDIGPLPASAWWYAWLLAAWVTGERTGALRRLCWEHVDLDRKLIEVPGAIRKTGKAAMYDLPDMAVDVLREIQGDWPLVFPWPLSNASFYKRFNLLLAAAGLPPGRKNQTQRIRRSHLTYWQAGGGDACARAQHSSVGVTWKHYLDRSLLPRERVEERLPEVASVDALNPVDLLPRCACCGTPMTAHQYGRKRYCSDKCQRRGKQGLPPAELPTHCQECGQAMSARSHRKRYCGESCRRAARRPR